MKKIKSVCSPFNAKPRKLKVTWTTMSETLLDTTYDVSAEEQLVRLASSMNNEELKKAIEEERKAREEAEKRRQMKEYAEVYFE